MRCERELEGGRWWVQCIVKQHRVYGVYYAHVAASPSAEVGWCSGTGNPVVFYNFFMVQVLQKLSKNKRKEWRTFCAQALTRYSLRQSHPRETRRTWRTRATAVKDLRSGV
jgi:hypothetical protein